MLSKIEDEKSAQLCTAERSLLYYLEGGCQVRCHSRHAVIRVDYAVRLFLTLLARRLLLHASV